jgi:hypothetical protein
MFTVYPSPGKWLGNKKDKHDGLMENFADFEGKVEQCEFPFKVFCFLTI